MVVSVADSRGPSLPPHLPEVPGSPAGVVVVKARVDFDVALEVDALIKAILIAAA